MSDPDYNYLDAFPTFDEKDRLGLYASHSSAKDAAGLADRYKKTFGNSIDADYVNSLGSTERNQLTGALDKQDAFNLGAPSQEGGIGSWFADKGNMNMIGVGAGIGQMGLGLASFFQQKDLAKKQGRLLDQQLEHNRYEMDNRKALQASLNN